MPETTIYISARREKLLDELWRCYQEVEKSSSGDGLVSVTLHGESNDQRDLDEWKVVFSNDDMERPEMDGRVLFDIEARGR